MPTKMASTSSANPQLPSKRNASTAGFNHPSGRPAKRRASKACACCRARKVRCNVVEHGAPCTNCRLDDVECIVQDSKRRKYVIHRNRRVSHVFTCLCQSIRFCIHSIRASAVTYVSLTTEALTRIPASFAGNSGTNSTTLRLRRHRRFMLRSGKLPRLSERTVSNPRPMAMPLSGVFPNVNRPCLPRACRTTRSAIKSSTCLI